MLKISHYARKRGSITGQKVTFNRENIATYRNIQSYVSCEDTFATIITECPPSLDINILYGSINYG